MRFRPSLLAALIAMFTYVAAPGIIYSCGPYTPTAVLYYSYTPETPLSRFIQGELGIVHPGLRPYYLFVAYRHLSGSPLNPNEQQVVKAYWRKVLGGYAEPDMQAREAWQRARATVKPGKIELHRGREYQQFRWYPNCQDDAYRNAARTLTQRIATFGPRSPHVHFWVEAQDIVFSNCESGRNIPPPAAPGSPPVFHADRAYQIAAAYFYSGDFKAAESAFQAIASDRSSPWRGIAHYLQARAIIRSAMLDFDDEDARPDRASLERALALLRQIAADPALREYHLMARERAGLVEARLQPQQRLEHLAHLLARPHRSDLLTQELGDLLYLVQRHKAVGADLALWIQTMQALEPNHPDYGSARARSLALWQRKKTLPWLVAAMSASQEQAAPALLEEARSALSPASPARATAMAFLARAGTPADRRTLAADPTLPTLPTSTANRVRQAQWLRAEDMDSFLLSLPRRVVRSYWYAEDEHLFDRYAIRDYPPVPVVARRYLFDEDGARVINRRLPFTHLAVAIAKPGLPLEIRRDLAIAAWTKAVLLGRHQFADDLVPTLSSLEPALRPFLVAYLRESEADRKRFAALFTILNFPGMSPLVTSGYGRQARFHKIENYRRNWWCGKSSPEDPTIPYGLTEDPTWDFPYPRPAPFVSFLSNAERQEAEAEWEHMASLETAPNLMAKEVLAYREKHPEDPRLPDALDLSLRALRYGCSDMSYRELSQRVFRTLHSKYPRSKAAKRNRPWG